MSLTRKMLKSMGLTDEQQDTVLEAHTETLNEIKAERDRFKAEAESLPDIRGQLERAQADLTAAGGYKQKYDALKTEYDDYKNEQTAKTTRIAKENAYRNLLKDVGISDRRINSVLKVSDIDSVELDNNGAIKNADSLTETVKNEWADFIVTSAVHGADTSTPPTNTGGGTMTKEEIFEIKDPTERQNAIATNLNLFGKE